jgi:hypothetical protein
LRLRAGRACSIAAAVAVCPARAAAQVNHTCPAADSAVYVAVLDSLYRRALSTSAGLVRRPTLELSGMGDGARAGGELARMIPGFDSALVAQLHQPGKAVCGPARALRSRPVLFWPGDSKFVWRDTLLVVEGRALERLPELRFSAVQYSADGATAVLYKAFWCGLMCAQSDYVVLHRRADGQWRIVAVLFESAS